MYFNVYHGKQEVTLWPEKRMHKATQVASVCVLGNVPYILPLRSTADLSVKISI